MNREVQNIYLRNKEEQKDSNILFLSLFFNKTVQHNMRNKATESSDNKPNLLTGHDLNITVRFG